MKIIFTSCARYTKRHEQNEWHKIAAKNPDLLLLLGDNIYMDWGIRLYLPLVRSVPYFQRRMQKMYSRQWANIPFKKLLDKMIQKKGLHGIWDDHDCGWNNIKVGSLRANKSKKKIAYSREQFFNKFPFSKKNKSIYYAHDTENIRFIFLDNRSFSTKHRKADAVYLGKEQFAFLAQKLNHDKPITIICGGLTLSSGHEKFLNYQQAYDTFCQLTDQAPSKVIYLSGDIHKNTFVTSDEGIASNCTPPPFEIISSGIARGKNRKHRWTMLEVSTENRIKVSFFNKGHKEIDKSKDCTTKLGYYLAQ